MSNINFSLTEYPSLDKFITGQEVTLTLKGRIGMKLQSGQGDVVSFLPSSVEVAEERRPSVQEVLLSKIYRDMPTQELAS